MGLPAEASPTIQLLYSAMYAGCPLARELLVGHDVAFIDLQVERNANGYRRGGEVGRAAWLLKNDPVLGPCILWVHSKLVLATAALLHPVEDRQQVFGMGWQTKDGVDILQFASLPAWAAPALLPLLDASPPDSVAHLWELAAQPAGRVAIGDPIYGTHGECLFNKAFASRCSLEWAEKGDEACRLSLAAVGSPAAPPKVFTTAAGYNRDPAENAALSVLRHVADVMNGEKVRRVAPVCFSFSFCSDNISPSTAGWAPSTAGWAASMAGWAPKPAGRRRRCVRLKQSALLKLHARRCVSLPAPTARHRLPPRARPRRGEPVAVRLPNAHRRGADGARLPRAARRPAGAVLAGAPRGHRQSVRIRGGGPHALFVGLTFANPTKFSRPPQAGAANRSRAMEQDDSVFAASVRAAVARRPVGAQLPLQGASSAKKASKQRRAEREAGDDAETAGAVALAASYDAQLVRVFLPMWTLDSLRFFMCSTVSNTIVTFRPSPRCTSIWCRSPSCC